MLRAVFTLLLIFSTLLAQRSEFNLSEEELVKKKIEQLRKKELERKLKEEERKRELEENIRTQLKEIEEKLAKNIWIKKYENYKTYFKIHKELQAIEKEIKRAKRKRQRKLLKELETKKETLQNQLELLKEYQESPFLGILKPQEIPPAPAIKNPFDIVTAFSYIKRLNSSKEYYKQKLIDLEEALNLLNQRYALLMQLNKLERKKEDYKDLRKQIQDFTETLKTAKELLSVYTRKIEENVLRITEEIKIQGERTAYIVGLIVGLFILSFILKWIIRRYIQDNQRAYMANKIVNFNFALLIIFILLFSYIENVNYLVTILGFASQVSRLR